MMVLVNDVHIGFHGESSVHSEFIKGDRNTTTIVPHIYFLSTDRLFILHKTYNKAVQDS
jgi:hypothetical protein